MSTQVSFKIHHSKSSSVLEHDIQLFLALRKCLDNLGNQIDVRSENAYDTPIDNGPNSTDLRPLMLVFEGFEWDYFADVSLHVWVTGNRSNPIFCFLGFSDPRKQSNPIALTVKLHDTVILLDYYGDMSQAWTLLRAVSKLIGLDDIDVCGENITTYARGMEIDGRPMVAAIRSMFEPYSPITISDMTLNLLHSNLERMDRHEQLLSIYTFFSARYPKLKFNKDHNAFWFNSVVICLATGVAFCEIASKRIEWDSRLPIPKNVIAAANNAILMYVELHERLFSNGETVHQNPLFEQHWLGEDVLKEISPNCLNSGLMYNRFGLEINWLPQHIRIFDEDHPNTKVPLAPPTYITSMIRLYIEAHPANIQKFPQTLLPMQWS